MAGLSLAALGLAAGTAVWLGAGLTVGVDVASSGASAWLGGLQRFLPLGFAFGADMVSVVNPCGFAMLPAYLGLCLGDAFPWVGVLTGAGLVLAGLHLTFGGILSAPLAGRVAGSLAPAGGAGTTHYLAFGFAYAAASLGCTLPLFLAVLGSTLTLGSLGGALASVTLYCLGMGVVIAALTLGLALFPGALTARLRAAERRVAPVSATLLVVVGTYPVYYWLAVGGLLGPV